VIITLKWGEIHLSGFGISGSTRGESRFYSGESSAREERQHNLGHGRSNQFASAEYSLDRVFDREEGKEPIFGH